MASPTSSYSKEINRLFRDSRSRSYPKNQLIHYQGDPLSHVYLIKKGFIKAYTILESGDTRTIVLMSEGDIFPIDFSESMDWTSYTVRYFYQTLSDVSVETLPAVVLKDRVDTDTKMLRAYMDYLSASNEAISKQLEIMKNKKAIDKIGMLLPYLLSKAGRKIRPGKYELRLKLSHQEIADLSGVTRETTTTLIKELEKAGIIDQSRSRWRISTKNLEEYLSGK